MVFKVANFGISEEDDEIQKEEGTEDLTNDGKSWDDIIPEAERKKALEEEEQKKRMELYLPPRKRRTVAKVCRCLERSALASCRHENVELQRRDGLVVRSLSTCSQG